MKRRRPPSEPKLNRVKAMLDARVRHAMHQLRECFGSTLVSRRLIPTNLATGKAYTGDNIGVLQWRCMELKSAQPFFATFRQIQTLGGRVRAGEKGTCIKFFVIIPDGTDSRYDEARVQWATVFHHSQVEFTDAAATQARIETLEREQHRAHCPQWLEKLLALYEQRAALPANHAIAYQKCSVQPLQVLATRAVLLNHHQLSAAKIRTLVTPDLYPFMWPACGIPAADDALDTLRSTHATLDWTGYDAAFPRHLFASPTEYYMHTFYMVAHALHSKVPLGTESEDVIHCLLNVIRFMENKGLALGRFRTLGIDKCIQGGGFQEAPIVERAIERTMLLHT